jgi:hypothetical protein
MKIIKIKVEGELTPGDVLLVHTMAARGGRTTGGTIVEKDRADIVGDDVVRIKDTIEDVTRRIVSSCVNAFPKEAFNIVAKGNVMRFECQDSVTDVAFAVEVQGAKTERMTMEEF